MHRLEKNMLSVEYPEFEKVLLRLQILARDSILFTLPFIFVFILYDHY